MIVIKDIKGYCLPYFLELIPIQDCELHLIIQSWGEAAQNKRLLLKNLTINQFEIDY